MAEDANTSHTNPKRRIPSWVWAAIVTKFIDLAVPTAFGVITTVLVLLKAGLLQLAHWPVAAFIALMVIEIVLIFVIFISTILYSLNTAFYLVMHLWSQLFKKPTPERSRWLVPVDSIAMWTLAALAAALTRLRRTPDEQPPTKAA